MLCRVADPDGVVASVQASVVLFDSDSIRFGCQLDVSPEIEVLCCVAKSVRCGRHSDSCCSQRRIVRVVPTWQHLSLGLQQMVCLKGA